MKFSRSKLNLDSCIETLVSSCKPLPEETVGCICHLVCDVLREEPNILSLSSPLTVVGDVHG